MGMLGELFRAHGRFCAHHPWEVIFIVLTATVCFISKGMHDEPDWTAHPRVVSTKVRPEALDIVLMSLVRAVAVLYSYHRLRSLHRSHTRFVLSESLTFTHCYVTKNWTEQVFFILFQVLLEFSQSSPVLYSHVVLLISCKVIYLN